jgi:cytochrome c
VLPRYLHFIVATLAVTGLYLAGYFGRAGYPAEQRFEQLSRGDLRRRFFGLTLGASALQLIAGPLLFFTLPAQGMSWYLTLAVLGAVGLVVALLVLLWREVRAQRPELGSRFWLVVGALTLVVLVMGTIRHVYRETALEPHQRLVADRSTAYRAQVLGAQMRLAAGISRQGAAEQGKPLGQRVFETYCGACHAPGKRLVGPPLETIAGAYKGDAPGLVKWVKAPGKKRPDYPKMPPITLKPKEYTAVARYVLEQAK